MYSLLAPSRGRKITTCIFVVKQCNNGLFVLKTNVNRGSWSLTRTCINICMLTEYERSIFLQIFLFYNFDCNMSTEYLKDVSHKRILQRNVMVVLPCSVYINIMGH